jgi:hypothetical protein
VNETGSVQRVIGPLALHLSVGDAAKFLVYERDERVDDGAIPGCQVFEEACKL